MLFVFFASRVFSQEASLSSDPNAPQEQNDQTTVTLKNGQIVVTQPDRWTKTLDYSKTDKYIDRNLQKWIVSEESNPVKEALKVYKNKGKVLSREMWLVNKKGDVKTVVLEYDYPESQDKIIFSPNEDYVYYLGIGDMGNTVVFGVNLYTGKEFSLSAAVIDFTLTTCNDNKSYVVVQTDGDVLNYYIYTLAGDNIDTVTYGGSLADLSKDMCD